MERSGPRKGGNSMTRAVHHHQAHAAKRQCKPEAIAINVPDDILEEILLRLPVKSLVRFSSVCKTWRDAITSPHFERCQLQLSRARRPSMLVVPLMVTPPHLRMDRIMFFTYPGHGAVTELVHEKVWSAGIDSFRWPVHCNGLVMVIGGHSSQIFICNPATKELVVLPAGTPDNCHGCQKPGFTHGCRKVGFSVDPWTGKHKVVRCFVRYSDEARTNYSVGCEIFTLGSRSWKPAVDPPCMVRAKMPACLLGAIYWVVYPSPSSLGILCFDLHSEEFTKFPAPLCIDETHDYSFMTELDGKVCYAHALGHNMQLWMTQNDAAVRSTKWLLYCTIVLPWPTQSIMPFYSYKGSIYIYLDSAHIYRYDTECGALERVVDMKQEMAYFHSRGTMYPYI